MQIQIDVTKPRYAHLAGFSAEEIALIMALADLAEGKEHPQNETEK